MWKPFILEREKTTSSSQSSIPLCIGNNYKRCVFIREKIREDKDSLKVFEVWNSHVWRNLDRKASLRFFGMFSLSLSLSLSLWFMFLL